MAVMSRRKATKRRSQKPKEWLEEELTEPLELEETLLMPEQEEEFVEPLEGEPGLDTLPEDWEEFWFEQGEFPELPEDLVVKPEELAEEEAHAAVEDAMAAVGAGTSASSPSDKGARARTGKANGESHPGSPKSAPSLCGTRIRHQVAKVARKRNL